MESQVTNINELIIGKDYSNKSIVEIFRVANMGGMRRSSITNTLVIISDHTKMYDDRTEINSEGKEVLHYTGMGKNGDQSLSFAQSKTLNDSNTNGIKVYLFEKFIKDGGYTFRGLVKLIKKPYREKQLGEDGNERSVWMFPLQVINDSIIINHEKIKEIQYTKEAKVEKETKELTLLKLEELAVRAKEKSTRRTFVMSYTRDPFVTAYAKRRADGICDLCEQPAPFNDKKGNPYLECHHIDFLSKGGPDTIENVVALCVTCHKKQHILEDISEKNYLLNKYNNIYKSQIKEVW